MMNRICSDKRMHTFLSTNASTLLPILSHQPIKISSVASPPLSTAMIIWTWKDNISRKERFTSWLITWVINSWILWEQAVILVVVPPEVTKCYWMSLESSVALTDHINSRLRWFKMMRKTCCTTLVVNKYRISSMLLQLPHHIKEWRLQRKTKSTTKIP
jgi:hypothetical protein